MSADYPLQASIDRIVASVEARVTPTDEDVANWLRGGAAFWDSEHCRIGKAIPLGELCADYSTDEISDCLEEIRAEARELIFYTYASIPLRSSYGEVAWAITVFTNFTGDQLVGFFPSERHFRRASAFRGLLWLESTDESWDLSDERIARADAAYKRWQSSKPPAQA